MAKKNFKCKSEAQKKAIRASYAKEAQKKTMEVSAETYPHFRRYKKSGHPALIVGEQKTETKEEYKFRKVMHGEKDGRHRNEEVYPNPNPEDKKPMHISNRVRHDEKSFFSSWKYPWIYKKKGK